MGRRKKPVQPKQVPSSEPMVWLKAEIEFGTTFSYRQPDASAQFAIGSPIPSPATIKLALVDTAIRWKRNVDCGKRVFEWLKTCNIYPVPPQRIIRFRVFLKRLKPVDVAVCPNHPYYSVSAKVKKDKRSPCPECGQIPSRSDKELEESTGIRDYFLLDGPLTVFLQVPRSKVDEAKDLLAKLRKLGTSDSLCWCRRVIETDSPDPSLCPQPLDALDTQGRVVSPSRAQSFLVVRLSDLTERSQFEGFNPFGGQTTRARLDKRIYLLPLTPVRYGETWALLERNPLPGGE